MMVTTDLERAAQERWLYLDQGEANQYCMIMQNNKWLAAVQLNGELATEHQKRIMQRICDCVNACDGMDNPDSNIKSIESGSRLHYEQSMSNGAAARLAESQRDALADALAKLVVLYGKRDMDSDNLLPSNQQFQELGEAIDLLKLVGKENAINSLTLLNKID